MGGNAAKKANNIAAASLEESRRQYREQQAEKERNKEVARANAQGSRRSANILIISSSLLTLLRMRMGIRILC